MYQISEDHKNINGIYAGYFTGSGGNSLCLITFFNGTIAGADESGGIYDGEYDFKNLNYIEGHVRFEASKGQTLITGDKPVEETVKTNVPIQLPFNFGNSGEIFRIETPLGPINAIFKKIRSI